MKKIIFTLSSILLAIILFLWFNYYKSNIQNASLKEIKIIKKEIKKINSIEENNTILSDPIIKNKDEKIETLRKRFSLRWTIWRWDNFSGSNQPLLALNEYIKALRQNPKDEQIIKKLASTYFELKRFWNAVEQFSKIESFLDINDINKYIFSLIYLTNYKSEENITITIEKIKSLAISDEEKFYYNNVINSVSDFHSSKKAFDDYFNTNQNVTLPSLTHIKNTLINFKNFKTEDLYYKDALIIWSLFQNRMFSISNILAENLLIEKPNYKPMLLILWKGYYELWDLENAKKYLQLYYNLEPNDTSITYTLWTINFKLKDYITSNLYYNSALKNWFEPKIELQRKLAYNYYLSWDKRSMLNIFSYLLNEKDSNIDDFSLWIYHAILEWRNLNAINRSEKWLEKFSGQTGYEIFYAYLWWVSREAQELDKSRTYLITWLKINPKDPLLTLNMGYLEEFEEKYMMALIYLKRTVNINWDGEFWELAKREIEEIEKYLKILEKNTEKNHSGGVNKQ